MVACLIWLVSMVELIEIYNKGVGGTMYHFHGSKEIDRFR